MSVHTVNKLKISLETTSAAKMVSGNHRTVDYQGMTIAYTIYNFDPSNTKPVLIFLYGWCGSTALWSGQEPLYSAHPSILIDFPGHDDSSKPEGIEFSCELFARATIAVLEAEKIDRVVFVGHSQGGFIATMVLRFLGEEKVKGIVYAHSHWVMPAHYFSAAERAQWREYLVDDKAFWGIWSGAFTSKTTPELQEKIFTIMAKETPMHVRLGAGCTDHLPHVWREEEAYKDIPLLHIVSGDEKWDSQAWHHLPRLQVEKWDNVSHFLHLEDPEKFNKRAEEFLKEHKLA